MGLDVSPAAMVGATLQMRQAMVVQQAQFTVLRKAMDLQGAGIIALLQGLPQPALAAEGSVGTKLNVFA